MDVNGKLSTFGTFCGSANYRILHLVAIYPSSPEVLTWLIEEAGADIHAKAFSGASILIQASGGIDARAAIQRLLFHAPDLLNATCDEGGTVLQFACWVGPEYMEAIRTLIEAGADPLDKGTGWLNPMEILARRGH